MKKTAKVQISFVSQQTSSDKTEKSVKDIFRTAGQIMFNYHILVLKKNPGNIKPRYTVILAK